jgi:hypothetical protein
VVKNAVKTEDARALEEKIDKIQMQNQTSS